jgi:hypothetical protein
MVRNQLIRLLYAKYGDAQYIATVMNRREWKDVTSEEIEKTARKD